MGRAVNTLAGDRRHPCRERVLFGGDAALSQPNVIPRLYPEAEPSSGQPVSMEKLSAWSQNSWIPVLAALPLCWETLKEIILSPSQLLQPSMCSANMNQGHTQEGEVGLGCRNENDKAPVDCPSPQGGERGGRPHNQTVPERKE